jgi:hypothetical protein
MDPVPSEFLPEVGTTAPLEDLNILTLALLKREQFQLARLSIFDLRDYADYDEWVEVLESRQVGLAMAGVQARQVWVELSAFLDWCRSNSQRPNASTLDSYAASIAASN